MKKYIGTRFKYSNSYSHEYKSWHAMINRCHNPNHTFYEYYGGRGIFVCERWLGRDGFDNFYIDMAPRPSANHSLDRIDNNLGYSKENCRWATDKEQSRNRSNNNLILLNEEVRSLAEWCEIYKIDYKLVFDRLEDGWSAYKAFTTPLQLPMTLTIGKEYNYWTVINKVENKKSLYLCSCRCGKEKIFKASEVLNNKPKMCRNCFVKNNRKI